MLIKSCHPGNYILDSKNKGVQNALKLRPKLTIKTEHTTAAGVALMTFFLVLNIFSKLLIAFFLKL